MVVLGYSNLIRVYSALQQQWFDSISKYSSNYEQILLFANAEHHSTEKSIIISFIDIGYNMSYNWSRIKD